MTISRAIRDNRRRHELTQQALADLMTQASGYRRTYTLSMVGRLETGRNSVSLDDYDDPVWAALRVLKIDPLTVIKPPEIH